MRSSIYVLLLAVVLSSYAVAQTVWVTSSLERTGPGDAAGPTTQATVTAAKGETESFQIILKAPGANLANINVIASDLSGPSGQISQANYQLYAEKYVNVNQSSPDWLGTNRPLGTGWYPDPL